MLCVAFSFASLGNRPVSVKMIVILSHIRFTVTFKKENIHSYTFCSVAQANFRLTIINFHLSSYIIHSLQLWCLLKYFIFNFKFLLWLPFALSIPILEIIILKTTSFSAVCLKFSSLLLFTLSSFAFWFVTYSSFLLNTFLPLWNENKCQVHR